MFRLFIFVASLAMALWIVNKRQNSTYKLAWMIPVLVVPVLGILLYVFFSQRKLGKKMCLKAKKIYADSAWLLEQDGQVRDELAKQDFHVLRQSDYIRNASMFPVCSNTQTQFFPTGEAFFEQLKTELEKAERYIFMEYFIVQEGVMWNSVLDILKRKASQGVDVRFMYDDMGCARTLPPKYYRRLRGMGIKCMVFNTLRPELSIHIQQPRSPQDKPP